MYKDLTIRREEFNKIIEYLDNEIAQIRQERKGKGFEAIYDYEYVRMRLLIKMAWVFLFRDQELRNLRVRDIRQAKDYDGNTCLEVHIKKAKYCPRGSYMQYKGKAFDEIWQEIEHFKERYQLRETDYIIAKSYDYRDKPLSKTSANERLNIIFDEVGINRRLMGFHGFRRGRATHLALKKAPMSLIKDSLRHKDVATTNRYITEKLPVTICVSCDID